MNLFAISGLLIFITSLSLAIITIVKGNKKYKFSWFLFCLAVSIWGLGGFAFSIQTEENLALLWVKIAHIGVTFIPLTFLYFAFVYFEFKNRFIIWILTLLAVLFLWIFFSFGGFIFKTELVFDEFYYWKRANIVYDLFVVYFWFVVMSVFLIFSRKYKKTEGIRKEQIKYIIIGASVGFIGGIFNFMLAYFDVYPYANYLIVFFPLIITYAIIRKRFLDMRFVVKNFTINLFALITVLAFATLLELLVREFLQFNQHHLIDLIIIAVSIFSFSFIRDYYFKLADKYFFVSLYDSEALILRVADELKKTLEISKIIEIVFQSLKNTFSNKTIALLLFDGDDNKKIKTYSYFSADTQEAIIKEIADYLKEEFFNAKDIIFVQDCKIKGEACKKIFNVLQKLDIDLIIPFGFKDGVHGIILLGKKESLEIYNTRDLKVISIIASQAAASLQNALLYQQIKNFNVKLKHDIELATNELKMANNKLIALDEQKNDFITLVSHQLRTPIIAMDLYLNLIKFKGLPKDKEEVNKQYLTVVKSSIVRMLFLINNFLNAARIEGGTLSVVPRRVDIEEVIKLAIVEITPLARERECNIFYKDNKISLVPILVDLNLFHQVMHNILLNSIQYNNNKQCGVEVAVKKEEVEFITLEKRGEIYKECVVISIKDNGIGIPKNVQSEVFKKYFRAENAKIMTSDGVGLSLYVSYQILKQSGCKIWFESEENVGTTFFVAIPLDGMIKREGEKNLFL